MDRERPTMGLYADMKLNWSGLFSSKGRMNTLSTATDTATPMFKMFRHNQLTNYQIQDQMCSRYRKQNDDLKIDMNIYKMEDKL